MGDPVFRLVVLALAVLAGLALLGGGFRSHLPAGAKAPSGTMVRGLAPAASGPLQRSLK